VGRCLYCSCFPEAICTQTRRGRDSLGAYGHCRDRLGRIHECNCDQWSHWRSCSNIAPIGHGV